MTYTCHYVEST